MLEDRLESYRARIGTALYSLHTGEMTAEEFKKSVDEIENEARCDPVVQNYCSLNVDGLKQYAAIICSYMPVE